jgi:hypothetical protein
LKLDLNDGTWPSLNWKRNVALPLSEVIDDNYMRSRVAMSLTALSTQIGLIVAATLLVGTMPDSPSFTEILYLGLKVGLVVAAGSYRTLAFFHEIGTLSLQMTRSVQTLWAASFHDATSLPRKLLSFNNKSISNTMPLVILNTVIAAMFLLGWVLFRVAIMLAPAAVFILEIPIFILWRTLLRRLDIFIEPNFNLWLQSTAPRQMSVRVLAALFLFVIPIGGVIWWIRKGDSVMMLPFMSMLLIYILWLYFDLRKGLSQRVAEDWNQLLISAAIFLYTYISIPFIQLLFATRYNEPSFFLYAIVNLLILFSVLIYARLKGTAQLKYFAWVVFGGAEPV